MTNQDLDNILKTIKSLPEGNDDIARSILKATADSIALQKINASPSDENEKQLTEKTALKFSSKEISNMQKHSKKNSEYRAAQPVSVKEKAVKTHGTTKLGIAVTVTMSAFLQTTCKRQRKNSSSNYTKQKRRERKTRYQAYLQHSTNLQLTISKRTTSAR